MKKIKFCFFSLLGIFIYFLSTDSVLAIGGAVDKTEKQTNFLMSFFTADMLLNIIFAIIAVIITFFISKLINMKLSSYLEKAYAGEESGREELIGVISRTVNVSILILGFSMTLGILGVDIGIFMGGIGFGIGFTLKTFLTNFIAGIMMVTQGFYHNGDLVEVNGKVGIIKKIHALFTMVEQFDGVTFYIPNIKFMEENVSNYYSNHKRRVEIDILVDYNTDITKAKMVASKVLENFPGILKLPNFDIIVDKLDSSGVLLKVRFWISSQDDYFEYKSNVTETINLVFKQSEIIIPFTQVTISNRETGNK